MAELTIIRGAAGNPRAGVDSKIVLLRASRATLSKRRWRGEAEDGREFGFDLHEPLPCGSHFFFDDSRQYVLEQALEEVLEIPVVTPEQAARVAWSLGNLHFAVQVHSGSVRVMEDPAVLQLLARENIAFQRITCVFSPLSSGFHHYENHHHG